MIILHDPHANVFSLQDPSAAQLLSAARAILDLIYKVCATTFDLLYLDHWASTVWFTAGVALIRFLNARTAQRDEAEIEKLTEELGAVKYAHSAFDSTMTSPNLSALCNRFMLGNLGDRTGIGRECQIYGCEICSYIDLLYPVRQLTLLDKVYQMEMMHGRSDDRLPVTYSATVHDMNS